jgi:iron complex outermembrane receptor protein
MRALPLLFTAVPMALAINAQVHAQSGDRAVALEEIIVTATKRETSLQDTAIAVTAFSQNMLEDLNINTPFMYEALTPSLSYQQTPNRLSIRGIGRFSNSLGVSPGVAIYNDGIFTAEATSLATQPINMTRTEILRGPQGTLYGRNTTGGAVNIISRRPTEEFEADLRVKVGDYDLREYAGVVSGPITDTLRYKLHMLDRERDGLQDNKAGPDARSLDDTYYEAQIEWDISEKLHLWAEYGRLDSDFVPGYAPSNDPYDCVNDWSGLSKSAQYLACQKGLENASIGDPTKINVNAPGRTQLENNNSWTARLTYDFDVAELSLLYGLVEYDYSDRTDDDGTADPDPVNQTNLDIEQNQKQTTFELQLVSNWDKDWSYIAGLYYFEDENEQPYNINSPANPTFATSSADAFGIDTWDNPLGVVYFQRGAVDNESWAIFGEVDYPLNDQWSLTVGARYSEDDYKGEETQLRYYNLYREFGGTDLPYALDVSVVPFSGDSSRYVDTVDAKYSDTFENVTGKFTVSYRPKENDLFWGTISTGYKMGGTRLGAMEQFYAAVEGIASDGEFDEEEVVSYELGWKSSFMDNTQQTEVVAFFYDYSDMQQLNEYQTPPPGQITLEEVVNLDTEMYGLELSGTWLATDNLRAIVSYSYNDTEITSDAYFSDFTYGDRNADNTVIPENISGNELTLTPKNKGALSLIYTWPTSMGDFTASGTASYIDERYFDLFNEDSEDSYTRVDVQASWTSPEGQYKVLGMVTNATDEEVYNTASCEVNSGAVAGTPSYIIRCGGNPIDQRLWEVQFMVQL